MRKFNDPLQSNHRESSNECVLDRDVERGKTCADVLICKCVCNLDSDTDRCSGLLSCHPVGPLDIFISLHLHCSKRGPQGHYCMYSNYEAAVIISRISLGSCAQRLDENPRVAFSCFAFVYAERELVKKCVKTNMFTSAAGHPVSLFAVADEESAFCALNHKIQPWVRRKGILGVFFYVKHGNTIHSHSTWIIPIDGFSN